MDEILEELKQLFYHKDLQNNKVSTRPIGWHIDHALKVIIKSSAVVKKSNPDDYKWRLNFSRLYVFTTGSFPRGVARAPKSVVSDTEITIHDLDRQLIIAKSELTEIAQLPRRSNFNHPYFGMVHLQQIFKFLLIHTNHHVKIIRDILAANGKS